MRPLKIIGLRHGNTFEAHETPVMVGSRSDLPLTGAGMEQALKAGRYLKQHTPFIDGLYYGTLQRQRQTAALIAEHLPHTPSFLSTALDEVDYGKWEGLSTPELEMLYPESYERWTQSALWPEGIFGTTENDFCEPLFELIQSLYRDPQLSTVLLISSQGTFRQLLKLNPTLWRTHQTQGTFHTLKISTGAFCELEYDGKTLNILNWNIKPSV